MDTKRTAEVTKSLVPDAVVLEVEFETGSKLSYILANILAW